MATATQRRPRRGWGPRWTGAYRLTRLMSQGGMGTVYEAIQLRLDRRVAVKIMVPELTENPEAMARFRREVKITSQLAHPNVVQLLDYGTTASGQPYLVTEFLEGEDLETRWSGCGRCCCDRGCPSCGRWSRRWRPSTPRGSSTATSSRPTCCCCRSTAPTTSSRWSTSASPRSARREHQADQGPPC